MNLNLGVNINIFGSYNVLLQSTKMTSDEEIAEAVQEYPCLYDKARKGHCDRDLVKNCWLKVAEKCGFEDEEEAKRLFNNLKKRYNKARNESTCASGSGRKDAIIKKKEIRRILVLILVTAVY